VGFDVFDALVDFAFGNHPLPMANQHILARIPRLTTLILPLHRVDAAVSDVPGSAVVEVPDTVVPEAHDGWLPEAEADPQP
jgi:hypothetical protein